MARKRLLLFFVMVFLVSIGSAFAQGVQTATLQGMVTDSSGAPLPGVTVTVKSQALMAARTAVTKSGGDYVLPGLPPGDYSITFELSGMQTTTVRRNLPLGLQTVVDAKMRVAAVAEAITVTASAPTVLENQTVGANVKKETVDTLPLGRTPTAIGSLSPGVTGDRGGRATTPVGNQLSINGGLAYDNNFLINGVNVQDNIFGQTNNLFIEDAIQETQVLTSGISAEYGHFTGGVLNVITKSGGNTFSGTFRDDITKPSWTALTPYEDGFRGNGVATGKPAPHVGPVSNIYEATLGGPILRDRLWFFVAGRDQKSTASLPLAVTGINVGQQTTNRRPEIKLTGNLGASQTLQGDYISNPFSQNYNAQVAPLTVSALGTNIKEPNNTTELFYSGVFSSNLYAEARASKKHFEFVGLGGHLTDIPDSPYRSSTRVAGVATAGTFNAPYFDSTDPENRNNKQAFVALSYFLSKPNWGSHEIKGGFEQFVDERTGGNSQSATSYVFFGGYATNPDGSAIIDGNGDLVPLFNPRSGGVSQETRIANYIATRGAKIDITTNSLFINDRWNLNSHFNFNIGARYEKTHSFATGGIVGVDTSNLVPRLGASYDPTGNGKYKVDVTYAQYVGRYNPGIVNQNSPVGSPNLLYGYYVGPQGQGRDFAPGWDPNNYQFYFARVNSATVFFAPGMHTPISKEWTISGGTALTNNGWLKATLTDRKYADFIEDFRVISNGCTNVTLGGIDAGCVDNILYKNSNLPKREYQASELQAHYDILRQWGVEGNWTHQFKNDGNYEGEGGQALGTSGVGNYPEMQDPREIVVGRLSQYESDRIRLWSTYNFDWQRFGGLGVGLLWRYDSPLTFSYTANLARSAASKALNPGYHGVGNSVTMFFGDRGAGQYNATSVFDLSLQYSLPISKVTPWVKFDVQNALNSKTLLTYNTTIVADPNSPNDALGYPTGFTKAATFGRPVSATSYVIPRTYLLYAGIRF
ncbi:MAG TPA: carboxypeptidase regulatory-like domain-containing protein [Thermoanaerobaculia bacterium]|nr:carboxypeptidase regulatory-like domain-containing protein [Thermoanaerobaculia bacterium]